MIVRAAATAAIILSLGGCASTPWKGSPVASIGRDRTPHRVAHRRSNEQHSAPDPTIAEDALLDSLNPRSAEWQIAYSKIEADRDRRLAAKLVICRGCLPTTDDAKEITGSIRSSEK